MTKDASYFITNVPDPAAPEPSGAARHIIEGELYYSKGGQNFWSGGSDPRGLWASFTPVETEPSSVDSRVSVRRMTVGDKRGRRIFLKELSRKNKKQGEAAAAAFKTREREIMWAAAHEDWPKVKNLLESVIR